MIKIFWFNQNVSDLPANSKDLSLTRNGFMERSNHRKTLNFLNKDNKQVANRKFFFVEGLFNKLTPKVIFGICRRKHCSLEGKVMSSSEYVMNRQKVRYE